MYDFDFCNGTRRKTYLIVSWFHKANKAFGKEIKSLNDQRLGTEGVVIVHMKFT